MTEKNRRISPQAAAEIKLRHKFSKHPKKINDAYRVGHGHVVKNMDIERWTHFAMDQATADKLFDSDMTVISNFVNKWVTTKLTDVQYDILCALVYEVGLRLARKSTLFKVLNNSYGLKMDDSVKSHISTFEDMDPTLHTYYIKEMIAFVGKIEAGFDSLVCTKHIDRKLAKTLYKQFTA